MFVTKFNYERIPQNEVDEKVIVETAGYVPRQKTIENLLLCGQRLIDSRLEEYDGKDVDEALENAPICRVNNLGLDESLDLLSRMSDSARESNAGAEVGVSVSVNNNSELGTNSELSKEG